MVIVSRDLGSIQGRRLRNDTPRHPVKTVKTGGFNSFAFIIGPCTKSNDTQAFLLPGLWRSRCH